MEHGIPNKLTEKHETFDKKLETITLTKKTKEPVKTTG